VSDVNAFIDAVGKDVNGEVVPRIQKLADGVAAKAMSDYVPKVSAFATQLVKQVIDEQSKVVSDFTTALIADLFQRYRPEVAGDLRTKVVADGLEVTGEGVRLDLKRRDTGALVSSLDIPVSLKIKIDGLSLSITDATVSLDVIT
jgi:hypothetical protein